MSEHNEALADVLAEMRYSIALYADRIEAAWRRERAEIEADALSVGGVVAAARNKPSGDAAALREALVGLIDGICFHCDLSGDCKCAPCEKMQKAKAALAAPPRNCNRFCSVEQAKAAYCMEVRRVMIWDGDKSERFERWLFAPATGQKGETDGK